jgi:long-chain acyl-CoA synthetase
VRIDENGEICVSGASFCGYVGGETAGAAEIRTGDIGRLDDDGFLYILGRRRNVFITSYGRNVSPEWVEAEFAKQPSIAQVSIFGEARPWNVGVIVPAPGASPSEIQADLESVNQTLPDYARLGAWVIAQEPFSPGNGMLTANGRNRRTGIWQRYRGQIDACYESYLSQPA